MAFLFIFFFTQYWVRDLSGFSTMACRFANIRRFEDAEHKAVYLARISREPGYMSWSVDCEGKTAVLRI